MKIVDEFASFKAVELVMASYKAYTMFNKREKIYRWNQIRDYFYTI